MNKKYIILVLSLTLFSSSVLLPTDEAQKIDSALLTAIYSAYEANQLDSTKADDSIKFLNRHIALLKAEKDKLALFAPRNILMPGLYGLGALASASLAWAPFELWLRDRLMTIEGFIGGQSIGIWYDARKSIFQPSTLGWDLASLTTVGLATIFSLSLIGTGRLSKLSTGYNEKRAKQLKDVEAKIEYDEKIIKKLQDIKQSLQ